MFDVARSASEGVLITPQTTISPPYHGILLGARLGEDVYPESLSIPGRLEPFTDDSGDRLFPFRLFVSGIKEGA
jgi:hypothetical protein